SKDRSDYCQGPATQYISCNVQPCAEGGRDFRFQQCQAYNGVTLFDTRIKNSTWEPYNDVSKPCKLICRAQNGETRTLKDVIDGTSCDSARDLGICVQGICKPVGCDRVLGSTKPDDKCLVCDGDGRDCDTVVDSTRRHRLAQSVVNNVVVFPPEARSVRIKIDSLANVLLELRNGMGDSFQLNQLEQTFASRRLADIDGTLFTYQQDGDSVTYFARGPLEEPLQLQVRYEGDLPLIEFEYSTRREVSRPQSDEAARYIWKFGRWTVCSRDCGDGYQRRAVACLDRETGKRVTNDQCDMREMPSRRQSCNLQPCRNSGNPVYRWTPGTWGDCSVPCGAGQQKQSMLCEETTSSGSSVYVSQELCDRYVGRMPEVERACFGDDCPYWAAGNWADCSVTCGEGQQSRRLYCQRDPPEEDAAPVLVSHDQCPADKRPSEVQVCRQMECRQEPEP
ncbi:hypothetical protein EGW08_010528, partial [Elysia chlorotica]